MLLKASVLIHKFLYIKALAVIPEVVIRNPVALRLYGKAAGYRLKTCRYDGKTAIPTLYSRDIDPKTLPDQM